MKREHDAWTTSYGTNYELRYEARITIKIKIRITKHNQGQVREAWWRWRWRLRLGTTHNPWTMTTIIIMITKYTGTTNTKRRTLYETTTTHEPQSRTNISGTRVLVHRSQYKRLFMYGQATPVLALLSINVRLPVHRQSIVAYADMQTVCSFSIPGQKADEWLICLFLLPQEALGPKPYPKEQRNGLDCLPSLKRQFTAGFKLSEIRWTWFSWGLCWWFIDWWACRSTYPDDDLHRKSVFSCLYWN